MPHNQPNPNEYATLVDDLIDEQEHFQQPQAQQTIVPPKQTRVNPVFDSVPVSQQKQKCMNIDICSWFKKNDESVRVLGVLFLLVLMFTNPTFLSHIHSYVPIVFDTNTVNYNNYGSLCFGVLFALGAFWLLK